MKLSRKGADPFNQYQLTSINIYTIHKHWTLCKQNEHLHKYCCYHNNTN